MSGCLVKGSVEIPFQSVVFLIAVNYYSVVIMGLLKIEVVSFRELSKFRVLKKTKNNAPVYVCTHFYKT